MAAYAHRSCGQGWQVSEGERLPGALLCSRPRCPPSWHRDTGVCVVGTKCRGQGLGDSSGPLQRARRPMAPWGPPGARPLSQCSLERGYHAGQCLCQTSVGPEQERGPRCGSPLRVAPRCPGWSLLRLGPTVAPLSTQRAGAGAARAGLTHHMSPSWMVRSLGAPACP